MQIRGSALVALMILATLASNPTLIQDSSASPITSIIGSLLSPTASGLSPGITPNLYWPESIRGTTHFDGGGTKNVFPCGPAGTADERAGTVNVVNGEFVARFTLLGVKNERGPDFEFNLTYRSLSSWATHANLSTGWDFLFGKHIETSGPDYYYHDGDGRREFYEYDAVAGEYVSPPGFYDELTVPGPGVEIRDRYGSVQSFDSLGRLTSLTDRNENAFTLTYNATHPTRISTIQDAHNRIYNLTYNGLGKLHNITDWDGREAKINYDTSGRIATISTPGATATDPARITQFEYNGNNKLAAITDQRGTKYLKNTFDVHGSVLEQEFGNGKYEFDYDVANTKTNVIDRNGNLVTWHYQSLAFPVMTKKEVWTNRDVRQWEPDVYTTSFESNANLEITRLVNPGGTITEYSYDDANPDKLQQGNLLQKRLTHDGSFSTDVKTPFNQTVTTYTYEALFNQVKTKTDARGNDPTYEPPNGGIATAQRYTWNYTYDYEEAGLGDINLDGITTHDNGNLIRVQPPQVNPTGLPNPFFSSQYSAQDSESLYTYNDHGQVLEHKRPLGYIDRYEYYPHVAMNYTFDPRDKEGYLQKSTKDFGTGTDPITGEPRLNLETTLAYDSAGNVVQVTDPNGNPTSISINQRCKPSKITSSPPFSYEINLNYDDNDNLIQIGQQVDFASLSYRSFGFAYDVMDNVLQETVDATRPAGISGGSLPTSLVTRYAYDRNENNVLKYSPAAVTGTQQENVVSTVFDERDLPYMITRGGITTLFNNTPGHSHISAWHLENAAGMSSVTFSYDANGNRNLTRDGMGFMEDTWYNFLDKPIIRMDAAYTRYFTHYDVLGNVILEWAEEIPPTGPVPPPPPPPTTLRDTIRSLLALDEDKDPEDFIDGIYNGMLYLRRYDHDELNRQYQNDQRFFVIQSEAGRLDGALTPGDFYVSALSEPDALGRTIQRVNDNGHATKFYFDGADRLVKSEDALGNYKLIKLDANGNQLYTNETEKHTDGWSPDQTFSTARIYDSLNRLVRETDSLGHATIYSYDGRGNVKSRVDALGNVIDYLYDYADRKWVESRSLFANGTGYSAYIGSIDTYQYWDENSRLVAQMDGNLQTTRYAYDKLDRLANRTYADGGKDRFEYDLNDNEVRILKANGEEILKQYDALNREIVRIGRATDTLKRTFTWNGMSNNILATESILDPIRGYLQLPGQVVREFDSLGQVAREGSDVQRPGELAWTTTNQDGMRNLRNLTYPSGLFVARPHDALERLTAVGVPGVALAADYSHIGPSRVLHRLTGNGVNASNTYDAGRRLISLEHDLAGLLLVGFSHRVDPVGNRLMEEKLHDAANSELYGLDSAYRLSWFERGTLNTTKMNMTAHSGVGVELQNWTLDDANNWVKTNRTYAGSLVQHNRTHSVANELDSQEVVGVTMTNTYDDSGRLLEHGNSTYTWDVFDRLRRVTTNGTVSAEYMYDALDRRIRKDAAGEVTIYYWSGNRVLETLTGDSTVLLGEGQLRSWVYGRGLDEPVLLLQDLNQDGNFMGTHERLWYHTNALGSIVALTDEKGQLVEGYQYDPYGAHTLFTPGANGVIDWGGDDVLVENGTSPLGNMYTYTAREWDAETGMLYYRSRYMHPEMGRFIQRDSIGIWGDPVGLGNGYAYCGDAPVDCSDVYGTMSIRRPAAKIWKATTAAAKDGWDLAVDASQISATLAWAPTAAAVCIGRLAVDSIGGPDANYCAPDQGYCGNKESQKFNGTLAPGTSELDKSCAKHDECIGPQGVLVEDAKGTITSKNPKVRGCNLDLAGRAATSGCTSERNLLEAAKCHTYERTSVTAYALFAAASNSRP